MTARPSETAHVHTRLLKCALEVDDSRAYWSRWRPEPSIGSQEAFDNYWFGARSLARVKVLLTNFRARFDAFPETAPVLHHWKHMEPGTRKLICHWHLQLSDVMYRRFTGEFMVERRERGRAELNRDIVIAWVGDQGPGRWTTTTRIQLASKLMSCAYSAGLLDRNRDPRPMRLPRVQNDALAYLMYMLRGIDFEGTLLSNAYLASVGLDGRFLEERLASAPGLHFRRQGDLHNFGWQYANLGEWGAAMRGEVAPESGHQPRVEGMA